MTFSIIGNRFGVQCIPEIGFYNQVAVSVPVTVHFGALSATGLPHLPLLTNSPAVNSGDPNGCRDVAGNLLPGDQLATPRPQGARCDMGAVEYVGPQPTATATPTPIHTATPQPPSNEQLVFLPITLR
jgi:hypothetical protein